jgi:transposase
LLISRKEKEKLVIKLTEECKTTREIAKAVRISIKDIGKIIHKAYGDDDNDHRKRNQEGEIKMAKTTLSVC